MRQRCRIRPGCDRGCQRLRREPGGWSKTPPPGGAARRSHRSGLHQDRAPPHTRPPGETGGPRAGRGVRRSWRFAVKRSSTWKAHPNRERRPPMPASPRPSRWRLCPRIPAQDEPAPEPETPQGGSRPDGAPGIEQSHRVLVSEAGCRSRRDASFPAPSRSACPSRDSSRRPVPSRRRAPRLAASDRVRGEAARVNDERLPACSGCKARVDPTEGALVRPVPPS
jgi:hypothetical protein